VAKRAIDEWMERFAMSDWWNRRIDELSKGMQQKVQFVSTIVHEPKLIILDEPFSGLDPINTNLIKKEIKRLNKNGTSVIFSTHRMEQVEEICNHIVLIHRGRNILFGEVDVIKEEYKDHLFRFDYDGEFPSSMMSEAPVQAQDHRQVTVRLGSLNKANQFMRRLMDQGLTITGFQEILPTLNEIFIKQVSE
ncbi:MAG: DUF4162 domain-containing protein, partial [Saprospiraceae bacterium]|nr:DUF4162 domain-containing protein [Saprospiraceae bacterium]